MIERRPQIATAAIVMLALVWSWVWFPLSAHFHAANLAARGMIAALSLLPLALCMGAPFPQALKLVGNNGGSQVALAWSINGLMTLVGSVAAVVLSITVGFSAVLWLGAGAYVVATVVLVFVHRQDRV